MKLSIGIEGTFAPQIGKDTLDITGHFRGTQWRRDLEHVHELGLGEVRYPIPWHRVEMRPGTFEWGHLDQLIPYATEALGLRLIADPLHHTSFPAWLKNGFANPGFPKLYARFVAEFARRFPEITTFAPFNEPTCTLDFCGYRGFWYPYQTGHRSYVTMLRHTARGSALAVQEIRRVNPDAYILHVDTFEHHAATSEDTVAHADFLNERRFIFEELIAGKVAPGHALRGYLLENGFSARDLAWHLENPVRIDERGGNYYPLNEEELLPGGRNRAPSANPRGFAGAVRDYHGRVPYPLSLTETNIQGTIRDRISWFKYMLEQAESLEAGGIHLGSFAWYPLFDCAGWNSLLQHKRWRRDPQGILSCCSRWRRQRTELSDFYGKVARGVTSAMLPAYRFSDRHDQTLGPLRRQMRWHWVPQG